MQESQHFRPLETKGRDCCCRLLGFFLPTKTNSRSEDLPRRPHLGHSLSLLDTSLHDLEGPDAVCGVPSAHEAGHARGPVPEAQGAARRLGWVRGALPYQGVHGRGGGVSDAGEPWPKLPSWHILSAHTFHLTSANNLLHWPGSSFDT